MQVIRRSTSEAVSRKKLKPLKKDRFNTGPSLQLQSHVRYGLPNRSDMVLVEASQAWFKQGSLKPPSMVLSSEKCV